MERRISVRRVLASMLACCLLALPASPVWPDHAVVLVTSSDGGIQELSALDIRKAYLGVNVIVNNRSVRAIRLLSDERLNQIFMQSVIAMSERSYERRLLSLTLRFGRPRPEQVDSPEQLRQVLNGSANSIGYMWREDAEREPGLRIVRVLWQER